MANYDIVGNIAIVKFDYAESAAKKKRWANRFLREHKQVMTVVEKVSKFKGRLRVQKTNYVAGERTKESLYRENGCAFRFNIDSCYFSPRLAAERQEIAGSVKKGESVLVMFGGVAPFAVVIAKTGKPKKVVSVELSRECNKYARENVKRNKVSVEIVQGDVRRVLPRLRDKFDRIIMARPNLKDSFLSAAFPKVKKGGVIHYYGFCREEEIEQMRDMIADEGRKAGRKIKIKQVKKAGDVGPYRYRYRVDISVA